MSTTAKSSRESTFIRKVVGANVRHLRIEANMTQHSLSVQSDIYRTYLSRIEKGNGNPTIKVLAALAKALNVGVADLLKMEPLTFTKL